MRSHNILERSCPKYAFSSLSSGCWQIKRDMGIWIENRYGPNAFFPPRTMQWHCWLWSKKTWWFTRCLATAISLGFETQPLFESIQFEFKTGLNTNHVTLHKSCIVIIQKWSISNVALEETTFLHSTIGCNKVKNVGNRLEVQWPKYWTLHFQWTQSVVS